MRVMLGRRYRARHNQNLHTNTVGRGLLAESYKAFFFSIRSFPLLFPSKPNEFVPTPNLFFSGGACRGA